MLNAARHKKNDAIIGHLERLENIRRAMATPQPGTTSNYYEANEVVEAMKRLAKEISTDHVADEEAF